MCGKFQYPHENGVNLDWCLFDGKFGIYKKQVGGCQMAQSVRYSVCMSFYTQYFADFYANADLRIE